MSTGIELIAQERQRQEEAEGWTANHDDHHVGGELARAAGVYAAEAYNSGLRHSWPWEATWFKPTPDDPIRNLVKAGALYLAESERIARITVFGGRERGPDDSQALHYRRLADGVAAEIDRIVSGEQP